MLDEFDARSNHRRQAGFTLLEMIIVIAVLGMALGLVVTRGPMRSQTMEMQAAVNQVAQGLRVARSRAIANNAPVRFTVDIPLRSFSIERERPVALPRTVSIAMTAVSNETVEGRLAAIRFYPDGSATGGRIDLAAGQRVAHIGVDWLTGRVTVQNPLIARAPRRMPAQRFPWNRPRRSPCGMNCRARARAVHRRHPMSTPA